MLDLIKGQTPSRVATQLLAAATLTLALAACSNVQPFDYTAVHEIPPGPGLISGEDGEFVLFSRDNTDSGD